LPETPGQHDNWRNGKDTRKSCSVRHSRGKLPSHTTWETLVSATTIVKTIKIVLLVIATILFVAAGIYPQLRLVAPLCAIAFVMIMLSMNKDFPHQPTSEKSEPRP
jgi:hypothetical protein